MIIYIITNTNKMSTKSHGMSQVLKECYNNENDVDFLSEHVENIATSFHIILKPN